jgi:hypothetical protein
MPRLCSIANGLLLTLLCWATFIYYAIIVIGFLLPFCKGKLAGARVTYKKTKK